MGIMLLFKMSSNFARRCCMQVFQLNFKKCQSNTVERDIEHFRDVRLAHSIANPFLQKHVGNKTYIILLRLAKIPQSHEALKVYVSLCNNSVLCKKAQNASIEDLQTSHAVQHYVFSFKPRSRNERHNITLLRYHY